MDGRQFRLEVVRPVLLDMGMWSEAAENLLMMTAAHESMGFKHRRQIGGPALSYFQIEPATLQDLYDNYLSYRPGRQAELDKWYSGDRLVALENDDRYATAVARMIYARVKDPLPAYDDLEALALYAKRYWNTPEGKASPGKYRDDYLRWGDA